MFDRAVACLRSFEKKDTRLKARAAVNLSFIYYLEVRMRPLCVRVKNAATLLFGVDE